MTDTAKQSTPVCPHCGHAMTHDDMIDCTAFVDLFSLAPNEGTESIRCPICDREYWVQGGYTPHYTTAFSEEELQ